MKPVVRYFVDRGHMGYCNTCELSQWPTVRSTLGTMLIHAYIYGDLS